MVSGALRTNSPTTPTTPRLKLLISRLECQTTIPTERNRRYSFEHHTAEPRFAIFQCFAAYTATFTTAAPRIPVSKTSSGRLGAPYHVERRIPAECYARTQSRGYLTAANTSPGWSNTTRNELQLGPTCCCLERIEATFNNNPRIHRLSVKAHNGTATHFSGYNPVSCRSLICRQTHEVRWWDRRLPVPLRPRAGSCGRPNAVDLATLNFLATFDIKFTILSPNKRSRESAGRECHDVPRHRPTRAYRCHLVKEDIDLSSTTTGLTRISFEGLPRARSLRGSIGRVSLSGDHAQLCTYTTDLRTSVITPGRRYGLA